MVIYFVIAFMFWIPAIYFFLAPVTDWSVSARANNALVILMCACVYVQVCVRVCK